MKKNIPPVRELYDPLVPIKDLEDFRAAEDREVIGDRRDGKLYRYTPEIKLHVNIAVATSRPLLVLGPSGCGKSSLAFNLARTMNRSYYEFVVTSRSQAKDLFYRFDAVRRLGDAHTSRERQAEKSNSEFIWYTQYPYIEPGPLWWIFNRSSARCRGYDGNPRFSLAVDPVVWSPPQKKETEEQDPDKQDARAVLLIDEVDKAEPDFPNNLLVPLGSHQFRLEETAQIINLHALGDQPPVIDMPLVIITSNRERELPEAFIRRCVILEIPPPEVDDLVEIAIAVTGKKKEQFYHLVAEKIKELHGPQGLSIAEFLDVVQAIEKLNAQQPLLADIVKSTTWRQREG